MAFIFGIKEDGKNGLLSHGELSALLQSKSESRAKKSNCDTCATYIQNKTDTATGGGITTKYQGRTVFHKSSGQKGKTDGCSVFFTLSNQTKTDKSTNDVTNFLVAGIVAVGWHANGSDHIYDLDWGKGPPFFTGRKLVTNQQHQKGNA